MKDILIRTGTFVTLALIILFIGSIPLITSSSVAATLSNSHSSSLAATAPQFSYPVDGQTLGYEDDYNFGVYELDGASGYLWGFFQNGTMIWENWRDEGRLSGTEYSLLQDSHAHSLFVPGEVKVMVRGWLDSGWSEAGTITITLVPRGSTPTNVPTNTPTDVPTNVPTNTPTDVPTDMPTNTPTPTSLSTASPTPSSTQSPTPSPFSAAGKPGLSFPAKVEPSSDDRVIMPITFVDGGSEIASLVFSVDYDQQWLSFDPSDENGDYIPDAISLHIPSGFSIHTSFDENDTTGEIDIMIIDTSNPLSALEEGTLAEIKFDVKQETTNQVVAVSFSQSPDASFGTTSGASEAGNTTNGSVLITAPSLSIPSQIATRPGQTVSVPISLSNMPVGVTSAVFSIDYDQDYLVFQGLVVFYLADGFESNVFSDENDQDGEIDVLITDMSEPFQYIGNGTIMELTFYVKNTQGKVETPVEFSLDPSVSLGTVEGKSIIPATENGSVLIEQSSVYLPIIVQ